MKGVPQNWIKYLCEVVGYGQNCNSVIVAHDHCRPFMETASYLSYYRDWLKGFS